MNSKSQESSEKVQINLQILLRFENGDQTDEAGW